MVLGTGQSLKVWRYGNLILPDTTSIYQYCLSMLGKAQFMIQWPEKRPSWSHLDLPKGILCRKICNAKVYHQNIGASWRCSIIFPIQGPFQSPSSRNTVASSFSFSISSISMSVLEGNLVSCFLRNFPTFYTVFQHTSQNSPGLLQFIQRETFCVSVAVHQKDLGFPQIQRDAMEKGWQNVIFMGFDGSLWRFIGI